MQFIRSCRIPPMRAKTPRVSAGRRRSSRLGIEHSKSRNFFTTLTSSAIGIQPGGLRRTGCWWDPGPACTEFGCVALLLVLYERYVAECRLLRQPQQVSQRRFVRLRVSRLLAFYRTNSFFLRVTFSVVSLNGQVVSRSAVGPSCPPLGRASCLTVGGSKSFGACSVFW